MLAHLLRRLYLLQVLGGVLLGAWVGTWVDIWQTHLTWPLVLLALVGAVLLPLTLHVLVIACLMIVSWQPHANWLWWRAFWGELVASLQIFWFHLPMAMSKPHVLPAYPAASLGRQAGMPVVLVHGFICNHRVWDTLSVALRQAGHPVLALDLEPLFGSIDLYVPLIAQGVQELLRQTDAHQVVLVGHSMGGLAIRAWLRDHGSARVARVITLGTPHVGTPSACWVSTLPNAAQMVQHSAWLANLQRFEPPDIRALMHIAVSLQDNVVYPASEQILSGVTVQFFEGMGHLQLCQSPTVIDWVTGCCADCPV